MCTGDASITSTCTGVASLEDFCIWGVCAGNTFAEGAWIKITNVCAEGTRVSSTCIESTLAKRVYARRAWIGGTSIGDTCARIATFAWGAYIGSTNTKGAGGVSAVKDLGIHL